ncbi:MAG: PA2169 family four-helix-bundle protein [Spirosomataceae bacterium]
MENTQNVGLMDALNGLIRINNDRISGYQKASKETKDEDLKILFSGMLNESVNFAENLAGYVQELGGEATQEGTIGGNVHQAWLNFKSALLGHDREAILNSCEFGDKAAIEAYQTAMNLDAIQHHTELQGVLLRQCANLQSSLKIIESVNIRMKSNRAEQETLERMG